MILLFVGEQFIQYAMADATVQIFILTSRP